MSTRCPKCGELHDLADMEPSYDYPDAYLAVPEAERAKRTFLSSDLDACAVFDAGTKGADHYLRVVMPVPVRGDSLPCRWGVWVRVSRKDFERTIELWSDPNQVTEPPMQATLANDIIEYRPCLGLSGLMRLTGPTTRPSFYLDREAEHALVAEQRDGVYPERVIEWLVRRIHS
jgi:hypothetical protein